MFSGVHAILGHRGSGKSRLARAIIAPARRLLVVDTLGEHSCLGTVVTPEQLSAALAGNPDAYRYVVRPRTYDEMEWIERVAASRPGCCLFVDEIDWWYTDWRAKPGEGMVALSQLGRHYDQSLVTVARRPAVMMHCIMSQAELWCFPTASPPDRKRIMEYRAPDPIDLKILRERPDPGDPTGAPWILETEICRAGVRGARRGRFDLERGQYSFP